MWIMRLVETNRVPDWLIRLGIQTILAFGLKRRYRAGIEERNANKRALVAKFRQSLIAIHPDAANKQGYTSYAGKDELKYSQHLGDLD